MINEIMKCEFEDFFFILVNLYKNGGSGGGGGGNSLYIENTYYHSKYTIANVNKTMILHFSKN